jgi:hypothetical protein
MKENKLLMMQNQIKSINAAMQHLITLSLATEKTLKAMPGYEEALEKMKEDEADK